MNMDYCKTLLGADIIYDYCGEEFPLVAEVLTFMGLAD